jgi:hypothetical protein
MQIHIACVHDIHYFVGSSRELSELVPNGRVGIVRDDDRPLRRDRFLLNPNVLFPINLSYICVTSPQSVSVPLPGHLAWWWHEATGSPV